MGRRTRGSAIKMPPIDALAMNRIPRAFRHHGTELAGLAMAAAGLALAWAASGTHQRLPPGVAILLVGVAVRMAMPGRPGSLVTLLAAALVAQRVVLDGQLVQPAGNVGVALASARWLEAAGLLLAMVAALRQLVRPGQPETAERDVDRNSPIESRRDDGGAAQIAGLLVLSAIGAELLAAYDDSTGRVGALLFAVAFFGALYGAPALLIRECARRRQWGWPSLILLALALSILQPAVIDQALFSEDYRDIEGWRDSRGRTYIEPLGISAHMAQNFVLGHVIYSFCAPLAIAEAWRPFFASRPWLRGRGIVVAVLSYVTAATLIVSDPESRSASTTQLMVSLLTAAFCVWAAAWLGNRRRSAQERHLRGAPSLSSTVGATLGIALMASVGPENWTGVAMAVGGAALVAVLVIRASKSTGWTMHHAAAVALGFLLCRALLAFTYFPLVGDMSAARKYTHNIVMLVIVSLAGWFALRSTREDPVYADVLGRSASSARRVR